MAKTRLSNEQISRYSRQLLLNNVGVKGQENIVNSKVLVVGAGGLGSPCILYLAAAGIGTIGIVDYDTVEISNLQRQIIHSEDRINQSKAESACLAVKSLNSQVTTVAYTLLLDKSNALDIISLYDVVVDCTDNVATRYLLNDASVLLNKPLVSGGALRMDGQVTVYNFDGGPCYRCLFPTPPDPSTVMNCSDGGVLGVVTGIVGSIQALEVLKLVTVRDANFSKKMLLLDAEIASFRTMKLRSRNPNCQVCGENPTITKLVDYTQFCSSAANDKVLNLTILSDQHRIDCREYVKTKERPHILIDVRDKVQFDICSLPNAQICRRGNDSQLAVELLQRNGISAKDIKGGLVEWATQIDSSFPIY